jgi:hypothetical protein
MAIPKTIFQISDIKPPRYVIDKIKSYSDGWQYICFNNKEMMEYIENMPPIIGFEKACDIYKTITSQKNRDLFFRYFYLYINGGVFIDNAGMIETNIEDIILEYSFCYVDLTFKKNTYYNQFIGCNTKNPIIKKILFNIYTIDKIFLNTDPFWIENTFYDIIDNNQEQLVNSKKYKELYSDDNKTIIYNDNGDMLYSFYYSDLVVKTNTIIKKQKPLYISETKIGLTFILPNQIGDMYSDGIKQNVLYLYELLKNIGYDVYFIVPDNFKNTCSLNETDYKNLFYYNDTKLVELMNILQIDFDIVINMGFYIDNAHLRIMKYTGTKIIGYFCGNNYIIESEKVLYNHNKNYGIYKTIKGSEDFPIYDKIWCIPQMYNTNKYYWQVIHRCECIEIPFIWSNYTIELSRKITENSIKEYEKRGNEKSIAILEPNLSIMKSFIPPLLICENYYRENKSNIKRVYLNNISEEKKEIKIEVVVDYVNQFDLFFDSKLSIEGRFNTLFVMSNYADIVVSHQWENNLNYLYLELAWMGYPVVHNGSLCKDVGYYYEGFNYEMGKNVLKYAIDNHDDNIQGYIEKNRKVIDRYLPSNLKLQEKYSVLIDNLFDE